MIFQPNATVEGRKCRHYNNLLFNYLCRKIFTQRPQTQSFSHPKTIVQTLKCTIHIHTWPQWISPLNKRAKNEDNWVWAFHKIWLQWMRKVYDQVKGINWKWQGAQTHTHAAAASAAFLSFPFLSLTLCQGNTTPTFPAPVLQPLVGPRKIH